MDPLLGVPENDGPDTATIPLLATGLGRDTKLGQAVGDFIEAEPISAEGGDSLDNALFHLTRYSASLDDDGAIADGAGQTPFL